MTGAEIQCLYCGESYKFLAGSHFKRSDHFGDTTGAFERYKAWVADEHDLPTDHAVFQTPGALTRPSTHEDYRQLFA